MDRITLRACGKLNLSLDIVGVREDGYHLMDMVMQSVSVFDRVTVEKAESLDPGLFPYGEQDIAYRAAQAFFAAAGIPGGARVRVEKRIPSEAGMAGGSADGAAVLVALDRLYGTGMGEKLIPIGEKVGADVPFCLTGGTARVQGIGERVTPLPFFDRGCYLVVKPPFGISTPAAFRAFDRSDAPRRPDTAGMIAAMARGDIPALEALSENVLEAAAARPEIGEIRRALREAGAAFSRMTGSGSAVFGLFETEGAAAAARGAVERYGETFLCKPVPAGIWVETCI